MVIRNKQNFASGVFFVVFGVFCALVARGYSLGTTDDIGAGYFPFWIAVLLAVLGAILSVGSLSAKAEATQIGQLDWKSTAWIVGAVFFGIIGVSWMELGTMLPRSGGGVRYPLLTHGPFLSWINSWSYLIAVIALPVIEAQAAITCSNAVSSVTRKTCFRNTLRRLPETFNSSG